MSAESDFPPPEPEPTRALLLAQALETCIQAERKLSGSADEIIARRPAWMRAELRRLVALACALDTAAHNAGISEEFRLAERARLMRRITTPERSTHGDTPHADPGAAAPGAGASSAGASVPLPVPLAATMDSATRDTIPLPMPMPMPPSPTVDDVRPVRGRKRRSRWLWRGAVGGLLAAVLAAVATLTASASSLPGQPLYSLKQATEELSVRLAPDDQARTLILLRQANARLDETARLLDQGRTDQVADTTQRFDETLDRATTTFVVTIADSHNAAAASTAAELETTLGEQQAQLQTMLASAPPPARVGLREALVTTERNRLLVADPKSSVDVAAAPTEVPSAVGEDALSPASAALAAGPVVRTDVPSRVASAPPPVDLLAPRPDVTPYVPDAPISADADHHEVDSQRAIEARAAQSNADTPMANPHTAVDTSAGSVNPRVEHLRIPALAPAPAVAHVESNADGPPADRHGRVAQAGDGQDGSQGGPPAVSDDAVADHAVTPSPNQSDTRGAVVAQPTAQVVAQQPPASGGGNHAAGGPADATQSGNSGPGGGGGSGGSGGSGAGPGDAASAAALRATRDLAANPRAAASPAPVVANVTAPPASTSAGPAQPDAHRDGGAHNGGGSPATSSDPHSVGSAGGGSPPSQPGAASPGHDHASGGGGNQGNGSGGGGGRH